MVYEIGRTKSGLRMGFTTRSCAAAAAKAATYMLLSGETIQQVKLMTPKGIELIWMWKKFGGQKNLRSVP